MFVKPALEVKRTGIVAQLYTLQCDVYLCTDGIGDMRTREGYSHMILHSGDFHKQWRTPHIHPK